MITVIFHVDLTQIVFGSHCSSDENKAIQAIRESIENAGLQGSTLQDRSTCVQVLLLPLHEKALSDLIYWCDSGKFPYKTLWLNDVAEWRDGNHQKK
jgi:hypothetical protein